MTDRPPGILRFLQSCISWLVGLILLAVGIILIPILLVMSGGNPRHIFPPRAMGDVESGEPLTHVDESPVEIREPRQLTRSPP
jgi:hypothetical protein